MSRRDGPSGCWRGAMIGALLWLLLAWLVAGCGQAEPELIPWSISDADYDAWERNQYRLIGGGR